jgi:phosphate-selective porin OprO/OprP
MLRLCALAIGLVALSSPAAWAQDDLEERVEKLEEKAESDWTVKWDNGFKVDSPDGEFKLKFGGRIQTDFTFITSQDQVFKDNFDFTNGVEFRRARLFFEGTVYDNVIFKAQYDFAGGDADFKDVYMGFTSDEGDWQVRVGHQKEPFSLGELSSSKYLAFVERALANVFSPGRNIGVAFDGGGDRWNWGAGWFYETNDFGDTVSEDAQNYTGRVVYRPIWEDGGERMLHIGLAATDKDTFGVSDQFRVRTRFEFHAGDRPSDTGTFFTDGQRSINAELAGVMGPFWFSGEYFSSQIDRFDDQETGVGPTTEVDFDGAYLQAGYYLTGEHRRYKARYGVWDRQKPKSVFGKGGKGAWEIAVRYSALDLSDQTIDAGELNSLTFALNWYPTPNTRFMLNYVASEREEGQSIVDPDLRIEGDIDVIVVRAQIDF